MAHIYSNDSALLGEAQPPLCLSGQEVTMIDAINHGLREEMERNPKIVMWGEDVADPKGWRVWRDPRVKQRLSRSRVQFAVGRGQYCGCSCGYGDRRL